MEIRIIYGQMFTIFIIKYLLWQCNPIDSKSHGITVYTMHFACFRTGKHCGSFKILTLVPFAGMLAIERLVNQLISYRVFTVHFLSKHLILRHPSPVF